MVPEVVIGPPVKERPVVPPETSTEVTLPEPPFPRQVPFGMRKQPLERAMPFAKVEVAVWEVTFKALAWTPQAKVEVAVVEVAVK